MAWWQADTLTMVAIWQGGKVARWHTGKLAMGKVAKWQGDKLAR